MSKEVWRLQTEDGEEYFFWSREDAQVFFDAYYIEEQSVDNDYPYSIELILKEGE